LGTLRWLPVDQVQRHDDHDLIRNPEEDRGRTRRLHAGSFCYRITLFENWLGTSMHYGKLAAFATFGVVSTPKKQLALVPVDSPQNTKVVDLQRPVPTVGAVRFTHDGKAVVYQFRDRDADNLWLQPLDGSPGKQITNFKSEQIHDFHWSFDGSKLGLVRGHTDSDVVLLEESKP
jgi:hypothetical protein